MGWFKRKKKYPSISRQQALQCVPVKSSQVRQSRLESGDMLLSYPLKNSPLVASIVKKFGGPTQKPPIKKLQLDTLGTTVWDLMDGKRSVEKISAEFAKKFQLHPREAEVSVTEFIRQLGKRGIIGLL